MRTITKFIVMITLMTVFVYCSKDENSLSPCDVVLCDNGGTCLNGACICSTGFEGEFCQNQITPSKISLDKITVHEFPQSNNGVPWDPNTGPDLWIALVHDAKEILQWGEIKYNASHDSIYVFNVPEFVFDKINEEHRIIINDVDGGPQGFVGMAGVSFTPYSDTNNFPSSIQLSNDKEFVVELSLKYSW